MTEPKITEEAKAEARKLLEEAANVAHRKDLSWAEAATEIIGHRIQTTSDVAKELVEICRDERRDAGNPHRACAVVMARLQSLILPDPKDPAWECFEDAAYFDMWCVRRVGERRFGQGFHVPSKAEAETLRDLLSGKF